MSWTFPRVAAAGILAVAGLITVPLPVQAQRPNPWRSETLVVAPAPRPVQCTSSGADCCSGDRCAVQAVVAQTEPFAVIAPATVPTARATGNWCRELPGMIVGLSFRGDEVRITLDHKIGGTTACMTMVGDCAVTRDGTVHGVITGTDIRHGGTGGPAQHEISEVYQILQGFVDQPFAFRCRMSDGKLMVSNWRIACPTDQCREFGLSLGMLAGIFQPVTGAMPQPKSVDDEWKPVPVPAGGVSVVQPVGIAPRGVNVNLSPAMVAPQPCPVPVPPALGASMPPLEVRGMMVETFHQMMNQMQPQVVCAPPPYIPAGWTAGPPLPPPPIAAGVYMVPPMPPMPLLSAPPMPAVAPTRMPNGTWARGMGPIQSSIEIKDGHLALTLTLTAGEEGIAVHHTVTADCYLTRSGNELVGVLTGMDISVDGKTLEASDLESAMRDLARLQKDIAEKPFALTFRMYDDTLVIGNVRLPAIGEKSEVQELLGMIAGRYKRSNGPAPRPQPMRVTRVCDGPQCVPAAAPGLHAPPAVLIQPVEHTPVFGPQSYPPPPPMPAPTALPRYVPPAQE